MSLRSKIVLILSAVVLLNALGDYAIQSSMVSSRFEELERDAAQRDLERAEESLDAEVSALDTRCRDWSRLASGAVTARLPHEPAVLDRLGLRSLADAGINLLYLCDAEGRVQWGRIESSLDRSPIQLSDFPGERLSSVHPLLQPLPTLGEPAAPDAPITGLLMTEAGPMIAASRVVRDPGSGAASGRLIAARFVDDELRARIGGALQIDLQTWSLDEPGLPARERELLDAITASEEPVFEIDGEDVRVYTTLRDVRRAPSILARVVTDRSISRSGSRSVRFALLSTLATALLILFVLLRLLQHIVIRPLSRLTEHALRVGETDDTASRIAMERPDELGTLSREFDRMMEKLATSRAAHADAARLVGMSEIATGVLHNVGNVLNSVNVSANLVARKTEALAVADLERMLGVLRENEADLGRFVAEDSRGKHLLPFLSEVTAALGGQREAIRSELGSLRQGIEHIIELVRAQQTYAGRNGLFETAVLAEQVDAALAISRQALGDTSGIEFVRDYEEVPPTRVDKRKLSELLVNLLQNALHSLRAAEPDEKSIALRIRRIGDRRVRIEVSDNGEGIARENLTRVFQHGFTTKPGGHGFGLHFSANAATEMKGRLHVESDGPGRGATFVLELPLDPEEASRAA